MLAKLVPPMVAVVTADQGATPVHVLPTEEPFVRHATLGRRLEFAAGRTCARAGLRQLGLPEHAILVGDQRAPVWPADVVGSITHCAGFTAAAVARRRDVAMLGIDAEQANRLDVDVVGHVASAEELRRASNELGVDASEVIFSAKESVYKSWFPATGRWLAFDAVTISIDRRGRFSVQPGRDLDAADRALLAGLEGRFAIADGRVLTVAFRHPAE